MYFNPRQLFSLVFLVMFFFVVTGCKKEEPYPELKDPIYKDLRGQTKKYEKLIKDEEKNLHDLVKARPQYAARTLELKLNRKARISSKHKIEKYKQKLEYYKIRTERRRVEGRRAYKIAFRHDKPWPDPKEYKLYEVHKRLVEAPLNWNYRVPKLYKGNPNFKDPAKFAKKESEKEHSQPTEE